MSAIECLQCGKALPPLPPGAKGVHCPYCGAERVTAVPVNRPAPAGPMPSPPAPVRTSAVKNPFLVDELDSASPESKDGFEAAALLSSSEEAARAASGLSAGGPSGGAVSFALPAPPPTGFPEEEAQGGGAVEIAVDIALPEDVPQRNPKAAAGQLAGSAGLVATAAGGVSRLQAAPLQVQPGAVAPHIRDPHAAFRKGRWQKPLFFLGLAGALFAALFVFTPERQELELTESEAAPVIGASVSPEHIVEEKVSVAEALQKVQAEEEAEESAAQGQARQPQTAKSLSNEKTPSTATPNFGAAFKAAVAD
ncbi:MAG: hypothetical protein MK135_00490 [Polyangiaceae bacterium]|nr:hypothetical protein [Polyangiaceae bacterium]